MNRIAIGGSVLLALTLGGLVPASSGLRAPERWAVLVGITHYGSAGHGEVGALPGAERDARAMRDVLVARWGLRQENINLILNEQANRAGIEDALTRWLPERARPGDHVLVYFAGYGSRVVDESGDEDDGFDETLVPADGGRRDASLDIVDDDLAEWLRRLPTDHVVYVHDASHGGGLTHPSDPPAVSRQLERPPDLVAPEGDESALPPPDEADDVSGMDVAELGLLQLAAARSRGQAMDLWFEADVGTEPFAGGAFTTLLVRELWRAPSESSWETVVDGVAEALRSHGFRQTPRLSGPSSLTSAPPLRSEGGGDRSGPAIPVTVVRGDEVEVGAGLALGLTSGSVLTSATGARLRITDVTRDRARASIESGSVHEGERVALFAYRYPVMPLRVAAPAGGASPAPVSGDEYAVDDGAAGLPTGAPAVLRLATMDNPRRPFEVEVVRVDDGAGTAHLEVRSRQPGHLTLVHVADDGTVTLLYPSPTAPRPRIGVGETRTVQMAGAGAHTPATAGDGLVRAFVTPRAPVLPLAGDVLRGGPELAELVIEALKAAIGRDGEAVLLDGWATSALTDDVAN